MRTTVLTAFTLIAFAANSLLCRMALGGNLIDPVSFTAFRLISGVAILLPIAHLSARRMARPPQRRGSWGSGLALFAYAFAFSLAYLTLDTGMGALILFGAVQATMLAAGLRSGERPHPAQWLGLAAALGGLAYLVSPGLAAPDPLGALLMMVSGIAWGIYSLRGKGAGAPVLATAGNFTRAAPVASAVFVAAIATIDMDPAGVLLAVVSGAVTSGLGYVLWYMALEGLTTTRAAIVQLLVPVIAAFGGVVVLAETVTLRLVTASVLILGGVALAVLFRARQAGAIPAPESDGA